MAKRMKRDVRMTILVSQEEMERIRAAVEAHPVYAEVSEMVRHVVLTWVSDNSAKSAPRSRRDAQLPPSTPASMLLEALSDRGIVARREGRNAESPVLLIDGLIAWACPPGDKLSDDELNRVVELQDELLALLN